MDFQTQVSYLEEKISLLQKAIFGSKSEKKSEAMSVAKACEPLMGLFKEELLANHFLNLDETPVQVLDEPGKPNTSKSYMWAFMGGNLERPTVLFAYHPTRGREALDFLMDFQGFIQTDGYISYDALGELPGIIHVGCLAHVRRNFMDVLMISKREKHKGGTAQEVIDLITLIYQVEKALSLQKLEPDRVKGQR